MRDVASAGADEGELLVLHLRVEGHTPQGLALSRRLRPSGAAHPALTSRAAHAVERKAHEATPWSASKSPSAHALAWAALWKSSS
jgi:hypothetical protein